MVETRTTPSTCVEYLSSEVTVLKKSSKLGIRVDWTTRYSGRWLTEKIMQMYSWSLKACTVPKLSQAYQLLDPQNPPQLCIVRVTHLEPQDHQSHCRARQTIILQHTSIERQNSVSESDNVYFPKVRQGRSNVFESVVDSRPQVLHSILVGLGFLRCDT